MSSSSTKLGSMAADVENKLSTYESELEQLRNVPSRIEPNQLDKYNVKKFPHIIDESALAAAAAADEDQQSVKAVIDPDNEAVLQLAAKFRPKAFRLRGWLLNLLEWDPNTKALKIDPSATMYRILFTLATNNKTNVLNDDTIQYVVGKLEKAGVPSKDYYYPTLSSVSPVSSLTTTTATAKTEKRMKKKKRGQQQKTAATTFSDDDWI